MEFFIDREKKLLIKELAYLEEKSKEAQKNVDEAVKRAANVEAYKRHVMICLAEYQDSFLIMIGNSKWTWAVATAFLGAVLVAISKI